MFGFLKVCIEIYVMKSNAGVEVVMESTTVSNRATGLSRTYKAEGPDLEVDTDQVKKQN